MRKLILGGLCAVVFILGILFIPNPGKAVVASGALVAAAAVLVVLD